MRLLDMRLLDEPPTPPDYLVDGLLQRQAVTILSGDTGTAKSILAQSLTAAVVTGQPWLGRDVERGRVLYLDEENPEALAVDRLRAFRLRSSHDGLAYSNRQGVRLGQSDSTAEVFDLARHHRADLIVIDTVMAACDVEALDNSAVVALYGSVFRPLAVECNAAVLLLHHESKPRGGQRRDAGMAMMGARQWAGQADLHLAIERAPASRYYRCEDRADGRWERYAYRLQVPKHRDGGAGCGTEDVAVDSLRTYDGERGALLWMTVEATGTTAPTTTADVAGELVARIVALVGERGETTTAEIAAGVGQDSESGTFKRALREAVSSGGVHKAGKGRYVRGEGA